MNLYLRYFDNEAFVSNADDAIDFLASIPEIGMNADLEADIRNYCASDLMYPKRYKVRPRIYFIIIKTAAESMTDFKQKKALKPQMESTGQPGEEKEPQATAMTRMTEERNGWYEGELKFKRVVLVPGTGKYEYRDTTFVAQCKAESGIDCYNRIVEHLRQRVDHRSQFPSAKGKNFRYKYLGMWK